MPRSDFGDGLTWWAHGRAVVEDPDTQENLALVPVAATDIDTGAPLQVRDPASGSVIDLLTNTRGETPATFLLPREQAYLSAGGATYTSETIELRGIYQRALDAEASALAAQAEAQAARQAAETAAASVGTGGTGGGGNSGFFRVRYLSGAWEYLTLTAALDAGMSATDTAVFIGAPRTVSPPSWIRDSDLVGYAGATA